MKKYTKFLILIAIYLLCYYFIYFKVIFIHREKDVYSVLNVCFYVILYLSAFLVIVSVILKSKYIANKTFWLIIIIANPLLGLILYYIFARDYRFKILEKKKPLFFHNYFIKDDDISEEIENDYNDIFKFSRNLSKRTVYKNNTKVTPLCNGENFFPLLKEKMINAKKNIYMEFYILKNDELGKEFLDILKLKAMEGLKCYLVYDDVGSRKYISKKYMNSLKNAGVRIACFEPLKFSIFNNSVNFRNHRKITVIDGNVGFIGGINLGNEYNHLSKKFGFWRDMHLCVEGYGVNALTTIFNKDWYYATNEEMPLEKNKTLINNVSNFMIVESGPDYETCIIKDVYFKLIVSAKNSIKIASPYLAIEPELMQAIKIAVKSGVKVEILVPGKGDKFLFFQGTRSYYDELLYNKVKIYEYRNCFMHSKYLIVDDEICSLGTVNFDFRSFNLNYEATALFNGEEAKKMGKIFNEDIKISEEINYDTWKKRSVIKKIVQGIINLLSPLM